MTTLHTTGKAISSSSILVPLDGSSFGELALPFAARLASASHNCLLLVSVSDPSLNERHTELQEYLEVVADWIRPTGVSVRTAVLAGCQIAQTLLEELPRQSAQLVVAATRRRTRTRRWQHGSVTEPLFMRAPVPLVLIPEGGEAKGWPTERKPRVLVPLDGSPCSEAILRPALALAGWAGAESLVLGVVDPAVNGVLIEDPMLQLERERAYIHDVVERLKWTGNDVCACVELGRPAHTIQRVAHSWQADVIAMAIHGWGGGPQNLPGRVASAVLERADRPLLMVTNDETSCAANG
jgi:nucleotide-binding universal stress UspA family protein